MAFHRRTPPPSVKHSRCPLMVGPVRATRHFTSKTARLRRKEYCLFYTASFTCNCTLQIFQHIVMTFSYSLALYEVCGLDFNSPTLRFSQVQLWSWVDAEGVSLEDGWSRDSNGTFGETSCFVSPL